MALASAQKCSSIGLVTLAIEEFDLGLVQEKSDQVLIQSDNILILVFNYLWYKFTISQVGPLVFDVANNYPTKHKIQNHGLNEATAK